MKKFNRTVVGMALAFPTIALAAHSMMYNRSVDYHHHEVTVNQARPYWYSNNMFNRYANSLCGWGNQAFCGYDFHGYVDMSVGWMDRSGDFTSGVPSRVFDDRDGFIFHQLAFTLASQPEQGFGFLINPIFGRDASRTAPYGWDVGSRTMSFDLLQAYLQYATGRFTLIGGKFVSLVDYEDYDPTQDTTYSRGILFGYAGPGTLLGFRGTYTATDNLDLILGVNNGWDSIRDFGKGQTVEAGFTYTFVPGLDLSGSGYFGHERAIERTAVGPKGRRNVFNLVGTYQLNPCLSFALNYYWGNQNKAQNADGEIRNVVWEGAGGYINYRMNDQWRASLRGEIFDDRDGFRTGVVQSWKEVTFALGYLPMPCLELRGEVRHDWSNVASFREGNTGHKNNQSFGLELIYKFSNSNSAI